MVYRISITVDRPLQVATAFAEIWGGSYFSLAPVPNSYIVLPTNDLGTAVEIYSNEAEVCIPQTEAATAFFQSQFATEPITIRGAIAVAASREAIEQIAAREQWQTQTYRFGLFEIVELWIDHKFMLELLPRSRDSTSFLTRNATSASTKVPAEMLN